MGKTNQPLVLLVGSRWENHPQIVELQEKGHTVILLGDLFPEQKPDLILAEESWNWDDGMFDEKGRNLETALKACRKRKKSGKGSE